MLRPLLALLAVVALAAAEDVPAIPDGGQSLIGERPVETAHLVGANAEIEVVRVQHRDFDQALEIRTTERPAVDYGVQVIWPSLVGVSRHEVLLVAFWARCTGGGDESGQGRLRGYYQRTSDPWEKAFDQAIQLGPEWRFFCFPFSLHQTGYEARESGFYFAAGYDPQTVQVGGLQVLTYKHGRTIADLPRTAVELTYAGRDAAAPWRKVAAERIERHRKGDLALTVLGPDGRPVPAGTRVRVRMTRHAYPFGAAIAAEALTREGPDGDKYREIVAQHFNKVVFENDLKHRPWEQGKHTDPAEPGFNREKLFRAMAWCRERGIVMRGHTLQWGPVRAERSYHPPAVDFADPPAACKILLDHMVEKLKATEGFIREWDVLNHPVAAFGDEGDRLDKRLGEDFYARCFALARATRPDLVGYVNEGQVMPGGAKRVVYQELIADLERRGQKPDGIGFMCHFGAASLTPPGEIVAILDRFAPFGIPLQATEFDIDIRDRETQADYLKDFMTAWFSHPATAGIVMWGFWEGRHWKPEAALWNRDWTIRPVGQAWLDLVERDWWTDVELATDARGQVKVRGFLGDYEVSCGEAKQKIVLTKEGTAAELRQ